MSNLLILMAWTLLLAVGVAYFNVWYLNRAAKKATAIMDEDRVVEYMAELTGDELGELGEKVFDARLTRRIS